MRSDPNLSSSSLENPRFSMHSTDRNPLQSPTSGRTSWFQNHRSVDPVKAFHMAASQVSPPEFKPDFKRMAELICEGVNVDAQDSNTGKSALHMVAETGSIEAARFLIGARCDINLPDHNGNTALHLAAMHDEAAMVAILIEEGAGMALTNNKGWTPMQTAIVDSFKYNQSVDSVKVMVGQGADLQDKRGGFSPTELAEKKGNDYLVGYMEQRLHGVRDHGRSLAIRLSDARYVIIFWILFVLINELMALLLMSPDGLDSWCAVHYLLLLLTAISHMASWCCDPGYLKNRALAAQQNGAQQKLNQDPDDPCSDTLRWCPSCDTGKPRRSKHCTICRLCVSRFDHHCPWINNCVGEQNHRVFVVFISSLMMLMLYLGGCCFVSFAQNLGNGRLPTANLPGYTPSDPDKQVLALKVLPRTVHRWITLVLGLLLSLMGLRVGWLWWEQVVRIGQNLTTYEETSSWRFPYLALPRGEASLKNDFDMGCGRNCGTFWNLCAWSGVGNQGENVVYYMYKLIDNVKKLRTDRDSESTGSMQPIANQPQFAGQDPEPGTVAIIQES